MLNLVKVNMKYIHDIFAYRERLRSVLLYFSPLPEDLMNELLNLFNIEVFPAKTIVFGPNTTENNKLYFVISGMVKVYYEAEGKSIVHDFKEENSFFLNGYYLYTKRPNFDYYETMKPTVLLTAEYDKIEALSANNHSVEHLARKVVEAYYASFLIRNYNNLYLSAEERFDVFMREREALMNKVPQKLIASYLGLTPETFSRLRAKRTIES